MKTKTEKVNNNKSNEYKCPLCGSTFDSHRSICNSCPLSRGCGMVCCPECGHQLLDKDKKAEDLKK